jgi:hypothetical protein
MKDNPVGIPVLEPRDVDGFLDNSVSIRMSWTPPKVQFLLTDMSQFAENGDAMRRTR